MMLIAALSLFAGCSNSASGSDDAEVDYAARLLGTWYTPGYDGGQYIPVTDEIRTPSLINIKQKLHLPEQNML